MDDARALGHEHAHGRLRARGAARVGGDHHARPLSITVVRVYTAAGCHLCEAALEVIEAVNAELPFELEVVPIDGDERLEAAYRELLPVIEIDGERVFTWFVDPQHFRERLVGR